MIPLNTAITLLDDEAITQVFRDVELYESCYLFNNRKGHMVLTDLRVILLEDETKGLLKREKIGYKILESISIQEILKCETSTRTKNTLRIFIEEKDTDSCKWGIQFNTEEDLLFVNSTLTSTERKDFVKFDPKNVSLCSYCGKAHYENEELCTDCGTKLTQLNIQESQSSATPKDPDTIMGTIIYYVIYLIGVAFFYEGAQTYNISYLALGALVMIINKFYDAYRRSK